MDIGEQDEAIIVEPVEDPFRKNEPIEVPATPVEVPELEPV